MDMYSKTINSTFRQVLFVLGIFLAHVRADKVPLPAFADLKSNYPGYRHHDGQYRNHELLSELKLRDTSNLLIHDTSALRLSYTLNHIGGEHSLGTTLIRLSKFGHDSVQGKDGMQYIFLPIAFGPYLADKYGYPNISKLHMTIPYNSENAFFGKQGILRVITYTNHGNEPKGHVALWDCDHFHQSKDWIIGSTLLTVEFWESPDSSCPSHLDKTRPHSTIIPDRPLQAKQSKNVLQSSGTDDQSKLLSLLKGRITSPSSKSGTSTVEHVRHPSHKSRHRKE